MSEPQDKIKRPASQYYWGDWWKDKGLHSCSLTARGLWHEMNCLMHEGEPYGHLTLNGRPMTAPQLANQCRIPAGKCKSLLDELDVAGVFSRHPDLGTIYSRRMVRDEAVRNARAAGGQAGASHGIKGAEHGSKGGRPVRAEGGFKTPLAGVDKPPPSSSSSSSSSPSGEEGAIAPLSAVQLPACPHLDLIDLFGKHLPQLPQPRPEAWEGKSADHMRARWRWVLTAKRRTGERYATNSAEALAWFALFFETVADSDFLSGRSGKWEGCTLQWLMKAENFTKVVQGNYDNKERKAA